MQPVIHVEGRHSARAARRAFAAAALAVVAVVSGARPLPAQQPAPAPSPEAIRRQIEAVRGDPNAVPLPPMDSIRVGAHVVQPGTRVPGTVTVARGDLDVYGTIEGNAVAVSGDVIVRQGGRITGDALSVFGKVRLEGGTVDGEMRALSGVVGPVAQAAPVRRSAAAATAHSFKLAVGWLAMLVVIGIGVLVFAGSYLEGVVESLERNFVRAFWVGIAGQLGILPVLLLLLVGLALTILGVLLIPFAVVAYSLAVAGLLTLGFLATAQVAGHSLLRRGGAGLSARGSALRALVLGIALFVGLWIVAAALTAVPVAGTVLRGIAFVICWVAATAGFGAALLSRAGSRREQERAVGPAIPEDSMAWQTPTPVSGVVAARRPTPAASHTLRDYR